MTPQDRIAQLAAVHGITLPITPTRLRTPQTAPQERTREPLIPGANVVLPASWRGLTDSHREEHGEERERRQLLLGLEIRLLAGFICRYFGDGWSIELGEHYERGDHTRIRIIHRDGYGIAIQRCWRDLGRITASAQHKSNRHDCPAITCSLGRPLGAIAGDIHNRLLSNGVKEAYETTQAEKHTLRDRLRHDTERMEAIAQAWGGRLTPRDRWQCRRDPEATIPGGQIEETYDRDHVDLSLRLTHDQAKQLGELWKEHNGN